MGDVRYSKTHEWCRVEGGVATCGITRHAIEELNDLTFLDYRAEVGDELSQGDVFGEVDSVKATSELYAPVSGTVKELNLRFKDEEELPALNASPEDEGWLIKIAVRDPGELERLLDAAGYQQHCANG